MPVPTTPVEIANTVVRNIVPLAGIVSRLVGTNILILYFVDTMLAMAVMFAGLMRYFMPPAEDEGWAARANGEAGYVAGAFITAFIAIPLGMPVIFMVREQRHEARIDLRGPGISRRPRPAGDRRLLVWRGLYRALQRIPRRRSGSSASSHSSSCAGWSCSW